MKIQENQVLNETGKRTVKSGDNPRPPINPLQFGKLKEAMMKYCSFEKDTFLKKV